MGAVREVRAPSPAPEGLACGGQQGNREPHCSRDQRPLRPGRRCGLLRNGGRRGGRGRRSGSRPSSASAKRSAVAQRFAGSFSSPRSSAASTSAETGTAGRSGRAGCMRRSMSVIWGVGPLNGGSPASISYSTHARPKMSLRPSRLSSPLACSGLMYVGVPTIMPVAVSLDATSLSARATPKSATSTSFPDSRMLSGLMSRWTTPWAWA